MNKKILIVLTSHEDLGNTGKKTGFWTEELAAPYYALVDQGAEITLASPKGGQPPIDPKSEDPTAQTDATRRMAEDKDLLAQLSNTKKLSDSCRRYAERERRKLQQNRGLESIRCGRWQTDYWTKPCFI